MGLGPQALQEIARVNHPIRSPSAFRSFLFAQIERERGKERERDCSLAGYGSRDLPAVRIPFYFAFTPSLLLALTFFFFGHSPFSSAFFSPVCRFFSFSSFLFLLFPLCLCLLVSYLCFVSSSNLFSISRSFFLLRNISSSFFFFLLSFQISVADTGRFRFTFTGPRRIENVRKF